LNEKDEQAYMVTQALTRVRAAQEILSNGVGGYLVGTRDGEELLQDAYGKLDLLRHALLDRLHEVCT